MLSLLDVGIQKHGRNIAVARCAQIITLAEYLIHRNEKYLAKEALKLAHDNLQKMQQELVIN